MRSMVRNVCLALAAVALLVPGATPVQARREFDVGPGGEIAGYGDA